jgi:hypothetical protein
MDEDLRFMGGKLLCALVCCIRGVTVGGGSSNDFMGCVVFMYKFWHLTGYGFFVSFGYSNVCGIHNVF